MTFEWGSALERLNVSVPLFVVSICKEPAVPPFPMLRLPLLVSVRFPTETRLSRNVTVRPLLIVTPKVFEVIVPQDPHVAVLLPAPEETMLAAAVPVRLRL